jgi:acyl-CoA synthetase (AMP-forming)/AMP-acid ligase II
MHTLLFDNAERRPDATCWGWADRDVDETFGQAAAAVERLAGGLWQAGVRKGDRVGILAHNGLDYLHTMFACWYIGAISAHVNVRVADAIEDYLADLEPVVIVYTHDLHHHVVRAARSIPSLRTLVCMDGARDAAIGMDELLASGSTAPLADDASAPAHLSFTSGTTGRPKGAVLSHEPTVTAARCIGERLRFTSRDRAFTAGTLASSNQLVGNLLPALAAGASTTVMGHWSAESGHAAIAARAATILTGNPTVLQEYADAAIAHGGRTPLRMSLSGGAPVPGALARTWHERLRVPLVESYGQSEVGGFLALGFPELVADLSTRRIGPPPPDKEVRVVDPAGRRLPVGETGELIMRGGNMWGYWGQPEATATAVRGEWLHTGDLGRLDADGWITMAGRRSEVIAVDGTDWYPRDIEEVLYAQPWVRESAVVGVRAGDRVIPVAAIVPREPVEDPSAVVAALSAVLGQGLSALRVAVVEELPMTGTGKIARASLSALLAEHPSIAI